MDDFLLDDETVSAMNAEYENALPAHLKEPDLAQSLAAESPAMTDEKRIAEGWKLLHAYCTDKLNSATNECTYTLLYDTIRRLDAMHTARFSRPIKQDKTAPSAADACLVAIDLYLLLPTPENAVVLTIICALSK